MKKCVLFLLLALLIFNLAACARTETIYERTVNGETYTIDMANKTLTHEEKVYKYEISGKFAQGNFLNGLLKVTYPDGTWYERGIGSDGYLVLGTERTSSNYNEKTYPRGEDLCYVLEKETLKAAGRDERTLSREKNGIKIVICIILALWGAFNLLFPEAVFWIHHSRWVKDAEPTEFAINRTRFAGVILIAIGIGVLLFMR